MSQEEITSKLKLISEAIEKAKGDPKKEERYLANIVDPQDANACESCQ